jgi:hypothetical protein
MQRYPIAGRFMNLRAGVGMMILAVAFCSPGAGAQGNLKPKVQRKNASWKLRVVSDAMTEKIRKDVRTEIEEDRLVTRSADVPILEIPLKSIAQFTRDTEEDYKVSQFFMSAATKPSIEHHTFGSKKHREELKSRAGLEIIAMIASLFPSHKEVLHVSWTDEEGTHFALFYLGREEGRAMLAEIKKQTGLEPRDLEKERKQEEKRLKMLQRQLQRQKTAQPAPTPTTPQTSAAPDC